MAFKVDENLPVEVADLLRQAGHDAATVAEEELGGAPDADISTVCQDEGRALITLDTDFGDIRAYPPEQYPGVVVLRLRRQDKPHVLGVVERLLTMLSEEQLAHRLWIVSETQLRIRG